MQPERRRFPSICGNRFPGHTEILMQRHSRPVIPDRQCTERGCLRKSGHEKPVHRTARPEQPATERTSARKDSTAFTRAERRHADVRQGPGFHFGMRTANDRLFSGVVPVTDVWRWPICAAGTAAAMRPAEATPQKRPAQVRSEPHAARLRHPLRTDGCFLSGSSKRTPDDRPPNCPPNSRFFRPIATGFTARSPASLPPTEKPSVCTPSQHARHRVVTPGREPLPGIRRSLWKASFFQQPAGQTEDGLRQGTNSMVFCPAVRRREGIGSDDCVTGRHNAKWSIRQQK